MGIIPALSLLAGGFCLLFGLIPLLFYGIFHVGVAALLILGGLLVLLPLLWKRLAKSRPLLLMRRGLFWVAGECCLFHPHGLCGLRQSPWR